jgi:hypothetical protein
MTVAQKKNRAWIWFFAFLVVASIGVAGFMIWFNLRLQLTPEKLEAEMERWRQQGPKSYLLTFTRKVNDSERTETFVVRVIRGRAMEVRLNGEPLRGVDNQPLPAGHDRLQWYTMDNLLRDIEVFLERDAKAGVKNYNVAFFDERTGALKSYIRSVRGQRQHIAQLAQVEPLPD